MSVQAYDGNIKVSVIVIEKTTSVVDEKKSERRN